MIPVVETERLILRGWRQADFEPYAALWSDEALARHMGGPCSREDAWRRMAAVAGHWTLRGFGTWAVEERTSGAFIGWCGLWYLEGWPEPELGYALVREAQGRGYATEACLRARSYAYDTLGWSTLISAIHPDNTASLHVARRLGARCETTRLLRGSEMGIYRHPSPEVVLTPTTHQIDRRVPCP